MILAGLPKVRLEDHLYYAAVIDERRTLRRLEPWHIFLAVAWGGGMGLAALTKWSQGPLIVLSVLAWAAVGLVLLYLTAPAASITITPRSVLISNPYVRHAVPRHLIQGVRTEGYWTARLLVDGARPVRLVALNSNLPGPLQSYPSHRQAQLVMRLIAEVPQSASSGGVRRRLRYGNLALALAAICVGVASTSVLLERINAH